jgi:ribonuclease HI/GNAT superfamily N-acetyltransferase
MITIQKLTHQYIEPASSLLKKEWLLHAEKTATYSRELIEKKDITEWLEGRVLSDSPSFECFVSIADETLVALMLIRTVQNSSISTNSTSIKIEDIFVIESWRGKGVAKALLQHVEEYALTQGINEVCADVYTFNQASRNLFEYADYEAQYTSYSKIVVHTSEIKTSKTSDTYPDKVKLYADGGSRGNPGPSAGGYVLLDMENNVVKSNGKYLGITTNNQAEYHSLKGGLEMAKDLGIREVDVYMDSLLVVNQMKGIYKIRNRDLWPIHEAIKKLVSEFKHVSFSHVPRELNKLADAMVNETLDARKM